ncbi:MAG: FAD-dependent oxidoreductase [Nitrococcus sp.]|nr:FAD-dependent oxidoreductase [Nitrococcus sp.]
MGSQSPPNRGRDTVQCCIAGGGPAAMMLGYLLARAGVEILVLEKHADFLRDFRGDTIHPSTLELLHELGLLEEFLKLPHQEARTIGARIGGVEYPVADFRHLPTECKFIAFMPQWDFLDFLARQAAGYPGFELRTNTEVIDLIEDAGRVVGVRARSPDGPLEIRADLVVAADGRDSILRAQAGLRVQDLGAPMDVLWFQLPVQAGDPEQPVACFGVSQIFIMIYRGAHWQCGFVIPKGSGDRIRALGLDAFRGAIGKLAPFVGDRVAVLQRWEDIKLLSVRVDRLRRWHRPGLLCIGDAAHAMSPVGGVGINLAIQDAVAAANRLSMPLRDGRLSADHLRQVQRRRELPARITQRFQILAQNRIISNVLSRAPDGTNAIKPPLVLRLLARFPALRRIPARLIGIGIRPEHIGSE